MIQNKNIGHLRTLYRIPVQEFGFAQAIAGATTVVKALSGLDDGAPELGEVGALGFAGGQVAAAGDSFTALDLRLPPVVDIKEPIGVRVLWANDGVSLATDAVTWIVTYDQVDPGEVITAPATALDTTIASQSPGASYLTTLTLHRSGRGIINANKFDYTARQGVLVWNVEADVLTNFGANEVNFLGLEIDYIPLWTTNEEEDTNVFADLAAI